MTNAALNILSIDGFRVLVVEAGGWRPEYLGVMVRECAAGLAVRPLDGDLGFLENLPSDLKYLVLMVNNPQGFRGIQRFSELEHLGLEFASRRSLSLAFDQAPALRSLSLTWNRGFAPLFEADLPQLNRLYISGQPYETLEPYQRFLQLKALRFAQGTKLRSTEGLAPGTESLEIYHERNLSRLSFETGSALTRLDLEKVKALGSLNGVESLSYLRWLGIKNSGSIASLAPIAGLTELEGFYAWESTLVVDGDLEVLCRLLKLKTVALASRRHYRPSVAEVEALLRERRDAQGV